MRIVCIGGGPAGLYFGLLMKKQNPEHEVTVVERNRPYDTFGWGVVFSDQTLGNLQGADAPSATAILDAFQPLGRHRHPFRRAHAAFPPAHGFCGIGRKRLLNILQARAEELGVKLVFETPGHRRHRLRRRSHRRVRRPEQRDPHEVRGYLQARHRHARLPLRMARHRQAVRRLHVRVRENRMGLVPGARVPLRRSHVDVHRRNARARVARGRARRDEQGGQHRVLRTAVRPAISTATSSSRTPSICAAPHNGSAFRAW